MTLLEIVDWNLLAAEFAFIAVCHTAEVTERSIVDKGPHLTAAVQYCGFRGVVGTMWTKMDATWGNIFTMHFSLLRDEIRGTVSRNICESAPVCSKEAAADEDHLGEFHS